MRNFIIWFRLVHSVGKSKNSYTGTIIIIQLMPEFFVRFNNQEKFTSARKCNTLWKCSDHRRRRWEQWSHPLLIDARASGLKKWMTSYLEVPDLMIRMQSAISSGVRACYALAIHFICISWCWWCWLTCITTRMWQVPWECIKSSLRLRNAFKCWRNNNYLIKYTYTLGL